MDKGGACISKKYKEFCKPRNIEIEYSTPRLHTGTGAVEHALQTIMNLIIANLEGNLCLTECVNKALNMMRFKIHTGLIKHLLNYISVENQEPNLQT